MPETLTSMRQQAEGQYSAGLERLAADDWAGACAAFQRAVAGDPAFAEAWANLGYANARQDRDAEAEAAYRQALEHDPRLTLAHRNLGTLLLRAGRRAEAEACLRRAVMQAPADPTAWSHLGAALAYGHREDEAESCYLTALSLDPDHADARFNFSTLLLRQGRFREGWVCFEARDWYGALERRLTCPRWQGEPLAGRAILLGCEAGYGDMIQFSRYAAVLKARGARRVGLLAPPVLMRLFSGLSGLDACLPLGEAVGPGWDCWSPLMSLPGLCGTELETIPAGIPYLQGAPEMIARWADRLPQGGRRVGLVWQGNPRFENDRNRSLPGLETLAPLGRCTGQGAVFVSLQKGPGERDATAADAPMPVIPLGPDLADFADTAAVIAQLDLVISVDTAVAHLAGALGRPCWLLLPAEGTDWRWLKDRDDSPWYPRTRLFRQSVGGDWAAVMDRVAEALGRFLAGLTSSTVK